MRYGCERIFIPFQAVSVEQGSVSRDNLYPDLQGLLCSEGEVCMTQGPLGSGGKWAGGGGRRQCLTLAGGTSPRGQPFFWFLPFGGTSQRGKMILLGPNKCSHVTETSSLLLLSCFTLLCSVAYHCLISKLSWGFCTVWRCITAQTSHLSSNGLIRHTQNYKTLNIWSKTTYNVFFSSETVLQGYFFKFPCENCPVKMS